MDNTVGILGAGAFGTAIAKIIAEKGIDVTIWSFEKDVAHEINTKHINKYLRLENWNSSSHIFRIMKMVIKILDPL